jgi:ABC-type uncharacterized transport system substrate-binding protein
MHRSLRVLQRAVIVAFCGLAAWSLPVGSAQAHPHVFVKAKAEVLFAQDGKVTGVRHIWSFDEAYSAYITQGLDKNGDGILSADELAELAKVNMESLPEVGFFTVAKANGRLQEFGTPTEARLNFDDKKILTLTYVLPLKQPAAAGRSFGLEIGDPTYFVAFEIAESADAVITRDAPNGCVVRIARPPKLEDSVAQKLAQQDVTATPDMSAYQVTTRALVACP